MLKNRMRTPSMIALLRLISPWVVFLVFGLARADAQWIGTSMDRIPRVFSLAVLSSEEQNLLLATPAGLFSTDVSGTARRMNTPDGNTMALALDPSNPKVMVMGGHTPENGDLGVYRTTDGARTWKKIDTGPAAHSGFHLLEISRADPRVVYGVTHLLHRSEDGGRTWRTLGPAPEQLVGLATSKVNPDTLYAATRQGLRMSTDAGREWLPAYPTQAIATMVHVSPKGRLHAFILGTGLVTRLENEPAWQVLSRDFQDRILFRMSVDTQHPSRLYAATLTGAIVTSRDGGRSWISYEGSNHARPETIARGGKLFSTYCQGCHGKDGQGQDPATIPPGTPNPILAPALDDSAHAWHHSDRNLVETILNGSPREGSPMIAWRHQLSTDDAEALVAYIKSLWSFRSLACQGARHMACMRPR